MTWTVDAVLMGRAVPFGKNGEHSAIAKSIVNQEVQIGVLGLEGDDQADLLHHGGLDKAIHHYGPRQMRHRFYGPINSIVVGYASQREPLGAGTAFRSKRSIGRGPFKIGKA